MVTAAHRRDFWKLLLSNVLLCASAASAEDDRRRFLYVPPGGGAHRVLQETPKEALPPGEYEVSEFGRQKHAPLGFTLKRVIRPEVNRRIEQLAEAQKIAMYRVIFSYSLCQ